MKKKILLFVFVSFFVTAGFSQNTVPLGDDPISNLSFEIKLNKEKYLPYEPLFVKFTLTNRTNEPVVVYRPRILHQSKIIIVLQNGSSEESSNLSLTSSGGPLMPNGQTTLLPRESFEEIGVPIIKSNVMNKPGIYKVRFDFSGLVSNTVDVKIEEPIGIDKQAFEFLNKHGKDIWLGKMFEEENGVRLMEEFVILYRQSEYGEAASYQLGRHYLLVGEKAKAKRELMTLKESKNSYIAENSMKLLMQTENE